MGEVERLKKSGRYKFLRVVSAPAALKEGRLDLLIASEEGEVFYMPFEEFTKLYHKIMKCIWLNFLAEGVPGGILLFEIPVLSSRYSVLINKLREYKRNYLVEDQDLQENESL